MTAATRVVLLTGAADALGTAIADAALSAGASVAAIAPRGWMVDRLRERLGGDRAARKAFEDQFLEPLRATLVCSVAGGPYRCPPTKLCIASGLRP